MVGLLVVNPVELVLRNVLDAVHNQRLNMARNLVQVQRWKIDYATSNSALVRIKSKTYIGVLHTSY